MIINVGCSQQAATGNDFEMEMALIEVANQTVNDLKWEEYAQLLHPEGLETFQAIIMPGLEKVILNSTTDSVNVFGKNFHAETLQNETPAEFFTDILNMTCEVSVDMRNTFSGMINQNVGAIADGDTLVYVVTRTEMNLNGQIIKELNVNGLKRDNGDWKVILSNKFEGIAMMVRRGMPQ